MGSDQQLEQSAPHRKPKRFIPLRYRFVAMTTALLVLLLSLLALTLGYWQSRTIKKRLAERGADIARSLAASSVNHLVSYNYTALEQLANAAARSAEVVYVIVHDKEGRIAGYSGRPDLLHTFLNDAVSVAAVASPQAVTQKDHPQGARYPVLDVAIPVTIPSAQTKWGIIRVGLSYAAIYAQVRQLTAIIFGIGVLALAFGVLMSVWMARQITQPLMRLVDVTVAATQGALAQSIDIHTNDEIEILSDNFSSMMRQIMAHKRKLELQLAEIQHMQKYTNNLLTTMNDGLISFTVDGVVKSLNPAAAALFDLKETTISPDASIWEIVGDRRDLARYVRNQLSREGRGGNEEIHVARGQDAQVLVVGSSVLENEHGDPDELILNLHDVTALKIMEARIRQAERLAALGTLAAGMAHEIRNPLSAIKTFVQLLPRKLAKPGFLDKFNRTVPREVNRINLLVEDLLDLAREPRYDFSRTDIRGLIQNTIEIFETQYAPGVTFRSHHARSLPDVSVDVNQFTKAIENLLRNAVQAMPDGGLVTVETSLENGFSQGAVNDPWMVIHIQDTGVGIDAAMLKEIFNPFFTAKESGTGLGLAITHKVVSEHGGHIEVTSQVGKGSHFKVYLKPLPQQS